MAGGLLTRDPPILNGLLGAATMNPNIAAQGRNALASQARGIRPSPFFDPEFYSRDLGPSAASYFSDPENALRALSVAPVPFLSDAAGLAADALMYKNKPESRNMLNFGLTGLGALPFLPSLAGMVAYHGSPYKFDKFDAAHIGKGEGAQAYGHGVYFAESPKVAQDYAVALAAKNGEVGGRIGNTAIADAYKAIENQANRLPPAKAGPMYNRLDLLERLGFNELPDDVLKYAKETYGLKSPEVAWLETSVLNKYKGPGNMYKVDIPDEYIPRMLDWDKPLSQQSEEVRKLLIPFSKGDVDTKPIINDLRLTMQNDYALSKNASMVNRFLKKYETNPADQTTRRQLNYYFKDYPFDRQEFKTPLDALESQWAIPTGDAFKAAQSQFGAGVLEGKLREMGIPGIRYLDQGSRGTGQGTSNFVIFPGNEGAVKILERK